LSLPPLPALLQIEYEKIYNGNLSEQIKIFGMFEKNIERKESNMSVFGNSNKNVATHSKLGRQFFSTFHIYETPYLTAV
jgi:hypothetical protein